MYLVKNIVKALQSSNQPYLSESEIKKLVNKAKRDYGTTNNTLRRLCKHGVLSREVGLCRSTRRPSFLYTLSMDAFEIGAYITAKEQAAEQYKNRDKIFYFGDQYTLDRTYGAESPIMIGFGLAPNHLRGKCLVVSGNYEAVTEKVMGATIIYFKKKKAS